MSKPVLALTAAALFAASLTALPNIASATPVADALAIKNAAPTDIEAARWGGGWGGRGWGGRGWGWGVGAGLLGGAIIGGALAAPYYYGYGPYYPPAYYGPGPYGPQPAYGAPAYGGPPGDAAAYCMRRYHSYDPSTGTFLGNDGARHPCP